MTPLICADVTRDEVPWITLVAAITIQHFVIDVYMFFCIYIDGMLCVCVREMEGAKPINVVLDVCATPPNVRTHEVWEQVCSSYFFKYRGFVSLLPAEIIRVPSTRYPLFFSTGKK